MILFCIFMGRGMLHVKYMYLWDPKILMRLLSADSDIKDQAW